MNRKFFCFILPAFFIFSLGAARAQSFSGDARKIGMGGIGDSSNITSRMIEDENKYRSFVIPLGLFQVLKNFNRFDSASDAFDPILAIESIANPIHFTFNRDAGGPRGKFVSDIVEGKISEDLNDYSGFNPVNRLKTEGLANPNWGKTFKFRRRPDGAFQGFYIGAGPYISAMTDLKIDNNLTEIFGSSTHIVIPNELLRIENNSGAQLALAITGGYRARFSLPWDTGNGNSERNGIYAGLNYNYLRGFRYEDFAIDLRFNTDVFGMVDFNQASDPVVIDYTSGRRGQGYAIDLGIGIVVERWEFGFAANGVGNRINWEDFTRKQWRLANWEEDGDGEFVEEIIHSGESKLKIKLPVEYIGNAAYNIENWTFAVEISNGLQGTGFHGGAEYRLGMFDLRGGLRYRQERWRPSGGVGLNLSKRLSVDAAFFGTATNIEKKLKPAIALSLRLKHT